jgi:hypothetical protein
VSMAGWNALLSLALALLWFRAARAGGALLGAAQSFPAG